MYHTFISSLCCAYHHPQVLGVLRVCRQQDHVDTPARACPRVLVVQGSPVSSGAGKMALSFYPFRFSGEAL